MKRGPGLPIRILANLAGAYLWLAIRTTRWRWINRAVAEEAWASNKGVILVLWHGRLTMAAIGWTQHKGHQPIKALVSLSNEGDAIATVFRWLGVGSIRGSSAKGGRQKGGSQALREMKRFLDAGGCVAITPDGPRGPRHQAQLGALQLAKMTGAPIIPMSWSATGAKVLHTWDGLLFPSLFGRGAFVWSGPIRVPRDADDAGMERLRQDLEAKLNQVCAEADAAVGVDTTPRRPLPRAKPEPEPAPVPEKADA